MNTSTELMALFFQTSSTNQVETSLHGNGSSFAKLNLWMIFALEVCMIKTGVSALYLTSFHCIRVDMIKSYDTAKTSSGGLWHLGPLGVSRLKNEQETLSCLVFEYKSAMVCGKPQKEDLTTKQEERVWSSSNQRLRHVVYLMTFCCFYMSWTSFSFKERLI